ncbi:MAG: hypothetical protein LCH74_20155 [Proteobacteria bacterium]|nr:hypothetical protein [Pseudomonadota bacterium]
MASEQLEGIRTVRLAALGLTLACAEYVGPVSMAVSMGTVGTLAEPMTRQLRRDLAKIEKREKRG